MPGKDRLPSSGRKALAAEIKALRQQAGLTVAALAEITGVPIGFLAVAEMEASQLPSRDLVIAVDCALEGGGYLIGLWEAEDGGDQARKPYPRDKGEDVDRRNFHKIIGGLTVVGALHRTGGMARRVPDLSVDNLSEALKVVTTDVARVAPKTTAIRVARVEGQADALLRADPTNKDLLRLVGRCYVVRGDALADMGLVPEASEMYTRAYAEGRAIGDNNLCAAARLCESSTAFYSNQPASMQYAIDEGLRLCTPKGGHTPHGQMAVRFHLDNARLGALRMRPHDVATHIDAAMNEFERLSPVETGAYGTWFDTLSGIDVYHYATAAVALAGMPTLADAFSIEALSEAHANDLPGFSGMTHVNLAVMHAGRGRLGLDQSLDHMTRAIREWGDLRMRGWDVRVDQWRHLTFKEATDRDVRRVHEAIVEWRDRTADAYATA